MQSWTVPALKRAGGQSGQSRQSGQSPITALKGITLGAGLIIALAAGLHSPLAAAHAMLTKAEPARRAQLTRPPAQVRLWFNEEVERIMPHSPSSRGTSRLPQPSPGLPKTTPRPSSCPCRNFPPGNTP